MIYTNMMADVAYADVTQEDFYLVINGNERVYVGENYYNEDTGEYIYWINNDNARSGELAKSFTFRIRYSITSSDFTVNSTSVAVVTDAHVEDIYGNEVSGYQGHAYQVDSIGIYARTLKFSIGGTQTGTVTGLQNGGSYRVRISNSDYLSDLYYLVGGGTITNL